MAKFDLHRFVTNPSSELHTITSAKKDDLLELAKHLKLDVRSGMKKFDIRKVILEHYMNMNILGSEAKQYILPETSSLTVEQQLEFERLAVEREKAKLAVQREQLELQTQREAREREREAREREREMKEREQLAMQAESEKLEILKVKMEHEAELAIKVEREKVKIIAENREAEAELAVRVEREKAKINIESKESEQEILLTRSPFDLAKNIKLVPAFTEYDPEDYFRLFEETAKHLDWPAEQWVWLLKLKLSGKAAKVIRHLEDIND